MSYDYSKLRGRIIEKYGTAKAFGDEMHWSEPTLYNKLCNNSYWKQDEINKASELLDISDKQIVTYFFTKKVSKTEHEEIP